VSLRSEGSRLKGSRGLKPPIIVNPNDTPSMQETLENIAHVLGKEPRAAEPKLDATLDGEDTDEDVEAAALSEDDIKLMASDDCDSPLPSEMSKNCKRATRTALAEFGHHRRHRFPSSRFLEIGSTSSSSSQESSSSEGEGNSAEGQIRKLEKLIKFAMKISKSIPEHVKKLEQLKQKQEQLTEVKARQEAVKTLEEHRRLMAEMAEHIVKLRAKLNELITKRSQLEASDDRLRKELKEMASSSSESSFSSESSR